MSDPAKLRIVFLWHFHQPYYKTDGTFLMPWVRMHGVKDYWDMVRILNDYPSIKQTFNFAPSLLQQLDDYIRHGSRDAAWGLSWKNPDVFDDKDRVEALKTFFFANTERMIQRYPRYWELLKLRGNVSNEGELISAAHRITPEDFRDMQVWWNLSWVGEYSRFDPPFKYYVDKQKGFTEKEKHDLLDAQIGIMKKIVPACCDARDRKQIEISASPFYHPIIPLLCDTNEGRNADPHMRLPSSRFRHPEDADHQVASALKYTSEVFGARVSGMWPSEGSVSDDALDIFGKNNVRWIATDETILRKTLYGEGRPTSEEFLEKYFPYSYKSGKTNIEIFFRDHELSDLIGFVYSRWNPDDAAHDFVSRLLRIREKIASRMGPDKLDAAVVPIILDGENAWEFYQSDGKDFLRTLYYLLEREPGLETVLPSQINVQKGHALKHIEPGSWINGNFNIWIGHPEDNKAWDLLHAARETLAKTGSKVVKSKYEAARKEIMIAEGSDWCWWYGDEHKSVEAEKFDELFRYHLREVYNDLGLEAPSALSEPIKRKTDRLNLKQPGRTISPVWSKSRKEKHWEDAGSVEHEPEGGAMQKTGMSLKKIHFGNDEQNIYLKIETQVPITNEKIVIDFYLPYRVNIELGNSTTIRCEPGETNRRFNLWYDVEESCVLALSCPEPRAKETAFSVSIYDGDKLIDSLPRQGVVKFRLV